MTKEVMTTPQTDVVGLKSIDARREIKRIAAAIVDRRIASEVQLTSECVEVAQEHYVTIDEVQKKVWAKVSQSKKLHARHPAGKTAAYHALKERATRPKVDAQP